MIKCNLARIMGEKTIKISKLSDETKINRGTITRLYHNTAKRVEFEVLESLCRFLKCDISELIELTDEKVKSTEK